VQSHAKNANTLRSPIGLGPLCHVAATLIVDTSSYNCMASFSHSTLTFAFATMQRNGIGLETSSP